ncbi:MAG: MGMT family protein [Candidatus Marinimicrobia bacterium]|nr:MGMT family protein [Candidatus Neomarinimicrobiota bacterium]
MPEPTSGPSPLTAAIYNTVRSIPSGRVANYGRVALAAGLPGQARLVGYALHRLPDDSDVPWHRVVNVRGGISLDQHFGPGRTQRALLEAEGVSFDARGCIDLTRYGALLVPQRPGMENGGGNS